METRPAFESLALRPAAAGRLFALHTEELSYFRHTKIIATLGPASNDARVLTAMIEDGMNAARINFSYGTVQDHAAVVTTLKEVTAALGRPVAILGDLSGPKLRTARLPAVGVPLGLGDEIVVVRDAPGVIAGPIHGSIIIPATLAGLKVDYAVGDLILFADGAIEARVTDVDGDQATAQVTRAGILLNGKGINLPNSILDSHGLTNKDRADLELGIELGLDAFAISFLRDAQAVNEARELAGDNVDLIAKIERPDALGHFDEILDVADGIMIARGDLGVELPLETLPGIQKDLIARTNERGKLAIVATEMLESMTSAWRPTRAEVSDVANAVLDGTGAVMLSGETAVGIAPAAVVHAMSRILVNIEAHDRYLEWCATFDLVAKRTDQVAAVASAATGLSRYVRARAIVCLTSSGRSAQLLSAARPQAPILAYTDRPKVWRQLALCWGVEPQPLVRLEGLDLTIEAVVAKAAVVLGLQTGDPVVVVASADNGSGHADSMRLVVV